MDGAQKRRRSVRRLTRIVRFEGTTLNTARLPGTDPSSCEHAATWRGVMQVGLIRLRRTRWFQQAPATASVYRGVSMRSFWRYAAGLAGSAEICRSAY